MPDTGLTPTAELDCRGLNCPLPVLKTKKAIVALAPGDILRMVATDPGSEKDFHLFIDHSDHQILDFQKTELCYFYWIRKG